MAEDCKSCEGLGVVRVEKKDSGVSSIMNCFCSSGDIKGFPKWRSEYNREWTKSACRIETRELDQWMQKLQDAREFWLKHGEVYGPKY